MKKKIFLPIIFLILFIIVTYLTITNKFTNFDDIIYNRLINHRTLFLDNYFKILTKLANSLTIIIIAIIFLIIIDKKNKVGLTIILLTSTFFNKIIKEIIRRPRPGHLQLIFEKGLSYPSGHAMAAMSLYGFLIYLVITKVKNKYLKTILIILLSYIILTIGISRIYLGVHYPSDIIGGYLLSLAIITGSLIIFNKELNYSGGVHEKSKEK